MNGSLHVVCLMSLVQYFEGSFIDKTFYNAAY